MSDEEFIQDLTEDQPEAAQWVAEHSDQEEIATSRKAYLHDRARRVLGLLSRLASRDKQQMWAGLFGLTVYANNNNVDAVSRRLRKTTLAVLRKFHEAPLQDLPVVPS